MRQGKAILAAAIIAAIALPPSASAAVGPLYDVKATWGPTNLVPGDTKVNTAEGQFALQIRNVGDAIGSEDLVIEDQLPAGVRVVAINTRSESSPLYSCSGVGTTKAKCVLPAASLPANAPPAGVEAGDNPFAPLPTGNLRQIFIDVSVPANAVGTGTNVATISGGGAPAPFVDTNQVTFGKNPVPFGIVEGSFLGEVFDAGYPLGEPVRQASGRPFEIRVNLDFTTRTGLNEGTGQDGTRYVTPNGQVRTAEVTLPRAMIGNPEAVPKCDPTDFAEQGVLANATACPSDTQVGYINIPINDGDSRYGTGQLAGFDAMIATRVALYSLEPPEGTPVDLAFNAGGLIQGHIYATLDPAQNYAIKSVVPNISSLVQVRGAETTLWGVPADPAHDKFRYFTEEQEDGSAAGAPWGSAPIRPFLTLPMDCGFDNGGVRIRVDSYNHPGQFSPVQEYPDPMNVTGCEDPRFRFEPEISMQPTSKAAGGPTGLAVKLAIPQRNDVVADPQELYAENGDVQAIATPHLKKAVVTLPKGMTVSPSAAQGLASCSPEQIGMGTDSPVACPDASQFGTLTVDTPLLPKSEPLEGFLYVAEPFNNPFHNFLTLYLVIQEPQRGILGKIAGKADLDPQDGQLTFTFDDVPQFPIEATTMSVKGGLRAGLVNPQTCGKKVIDATFYSWQDPNTPHTVKSFYSIGQNPDGTPCHQNLSERPFDPELSGGTRNNLAGSYSPLEIELRRSDEDQELDSVQGKAPPGLLGSLRGIGRCTDAAIAASANPERTGLEEIANPSCPSDTLVGSVEAGTGVGEVLTYVAGKIYLAGPYKGAPLSGVAIVPAVAGPFDLGNVVTRAPAYIDPKTAEITIRTDALPQIFKGVPVRVRDIRVHLDRKNFILNPTSCEPFSLAGTMFSTEGKSKTDGSRFQAADCASLGFKPKLTTRLFGGTKRGAHPKFKGIFKAREGDANVASAVITLPRSEFLDQSHIRTVCTRVQFAADACPAGSIYGHAEARTPLLEETLRGPVFLRSSNNKLPDLVAELHGIVDVEVVGRIDSIKGGIRANFESIPDVPVESFVITMQGGKRGLLVNSRDICARTYRLKAEFDAQSGKETTIRPKLKAKCGKGRKAKRARKARERR